MGLFDRLFGGGDGDGGGGTKVDKLVKKLLNRYSQTSQRKLVLDQLGAIGTEEAIAGILQRFTFRTDGAIVDEDEKGQAYDLVIEAGPRAIPALEQFITEHDQVYWPLKALRDIAGLDVAVQVLLRVLDEAEKRDTRVNSQKVEVVSNLRDFKHPLIRERLEKLTQDSDEDVRIMALDGLGVYGAEAALTALAERVLDPEESLRVKTIVYEQLVEAGWSLTPWRDQIEESDALPAQYRIGPGGALIRAS